jgi:hypothetical protein
MAAISNILPFNSCFFCVPRVRRELLLYPVHGLLAAVGYLYRRSNDHLPVRLATAEKQDQGGIIFCLYHELLSFFRRTS